MRVKKLIKTLVVCSAICICSYNMDREVFAQGTGDMSYEEGAEVYIPTAEDVELQKRKENEMLNTPMMLTEGFKTLAVTCYPQETNYYCGPATVKQVLHYLTGDNYSQGYYANLLGTTQAGTDFSRIPNVLNNRLGNSYYVYENIGGINNWYSRIRWDVDNEHPVVLDINTMSVADIPYNVEGHIVNVSGYDELSSQWRIRITDPYQKAVGNQWYSRSDLFNANNNHQWKAMIW